MCFNRPLNNHSIVFHGEVCNLEYIFPSKALGLLKIAQSWESGDRSNHHGSRILSVCNYQQIISVSFGSLFIYDCTEEQSAVQEVSVLFVTSVPKVTLQK